MSFLDNITSLNTREIYKKAIKHFTLKKMNKNNDSDYDYLINDYEQVINILRKTCNNPSIQRYTDCFHFVVHYLINFPEQTRNEYSIMYKKITAMADKQVRIKKYPLKRETKSINIFEVKEPEITGSEEQLNTTRVLDQKENNIKNDQQLNKINPKYTITNKKLKSTSVEEEIDQILNLTKLRDVTKRGYKHKILQLIEEFNPNAENLDFLITDVENVIHFIKKPEHHIDTQKGYYSPIVKFIYFLPFDVSIIDNVYIKYKNLLDSLPKDAVYQERTPEYYKNYTWITLREKMHQIMKNEKNEVYNLIISLYINQVPRRTEDYVNCLINKPDDHTSNILIFTKNKKQFIFNSYKNILKTGVQRENIINNAAIKSIQHYLNKHPNNTYLFENDDGTPMTSTQMESKIAYIARKYDLVGAWSINSLRHLIATFINDADYSDKQKRVIATAMGTSLNTLEKHYIDSKKETFNVDVLQETKNPKKKQWVKKTKK